MQGGGQSNCADNCITRRCHVMSGLPEVFSMTDRPCMKIESRSIKC